MRTDSKEHEIERSGGRSLKALHICKNFELKSGGGVARYIAGFISSLSSTDIEFRVAAPTIGDEPALSSRHVIRLHWYKLYRLLADADIVHVHGARTPVSALAAFLALAMHKRVIYTPHCYYDEGGMKGWLKRLWDRVVERPMLSRCDGVILLSEGWLHYLEARRLFVKRPYVIHNCVTESFGAPSPTSNKYRLPGTPSILSVSRLDPVKNIDTAIRALTVSGLEDAFLHIIGTGPDSPHLADLANALGVSDRVKLYGFVPDERVAEMAASADVFVLPSAQEGMPTTIIEMILRGVNVVVSDIPGNRAILDLIGLNSFHAVHDHFGLAKQIQDIVGNRLAEQVIAKTRQYFTWEYQRALILTVYGVRTPLISPTPEMR